MDTPPQGSLIGQILDGRYRVDAHIGEGGMGSVYKAEHLAMAQPVAIKVLLVESAADPSMVKRFVQEARSCFRIDHPNCVRVTDFGAAEDGSLYFAMEYLDGRTIGLDLHVDGPMSSSRVRHVGAQVADALTHAHGHGIIHRDLKPANIMLLQRGGDPDFVKVFDFGLGKLVDQGARLTGLTMSPLTQDGIVFGTPEYMSPEQAKGQPLTPQSDVYTLGVCCYEMLCGHLPFQGKTFTETLSKHVTELPLPPSVRFPDLEIEPALESTVMQCLEKEPSARPTTEMLGAALRNKTEARAPSPASTLASSETMVVSDEGLAPFASQVTSPPVPEAAATPPAQTPPAPVASEARTPRWVIPAGFLAALAGAAAVTLTLGGDDKNTSENKIAVAADAMPVALPRVDASPPPNVVDAAPDVVAPDVDASQNAAPPKQAKSAATSDLHLQAAEKARRAGNVLKQLSEAQASLRARPKNRRAAFLVAEALDKSGDKVAACTYYRRAGKQHARTKGCSD